MTSIDRFLDDLPVTLIDLADERMPAYVDDLLGQTAASSQRPAWTFPGRWIPMAEIVADRRFVPQLPWRALAVAALALLLIAGALWFAGSRHRVPAPFGPAANGLIAYAKFGDIYVGNATTGDSRLVISGPELDGSPSFSPNGELIAFLRENATQQFDLMVGSVDGRNVVRVSTTPLVDRGNFQWSADSLGLFVIYANGDLVRADANGGPPKVIAQNVDVDAHAVRPPDGREIVFQRHGDDRTLLLMNVDGTNPRSLVQAGDDGNFNGQRWSPDGSRLVIIRNPDPDHARLFVMNADGTGLHQLSSDPRQLFETDPVWSPDGTRIAYNRWVRDAATGNWNVQPLGIATVATGAVFEAGPTPVSDGSLFDWSPDGTMLLGLPGAHATFGSSVSDAPTVIDALTGVERPLDWSVESAVSWQRAAP